MLYSLYFKLLLFLKEEISDKRIFSYILSSEEYMFAESLGGWDEKNYIFVSN